MNKKTISQENKQLQDLLENEIKMILEQLPCDSWHEESLESIDDKMWLFRFKSNGISGQFFTLSYGRTPAEAISTGKRQIFSQIREWRSHRTFSSDTISSTYDLQPIPQEQLVLIVDDDVDVANALDMAFRNLGFQTYMVTDYNVLDKKIMEVHPDLILMDWQLAEKITADIAVEKASLLISAFSHLREKFKAHQTKVITHSVLDREKVRLPATSYGYFEHIGHWQKPMPYDEVAKRAAEILQNIH